MIYLGVFLFVLVVPATVFFLYLTITEYKPKKIEESITYKSSRNKELNTEYTISTYNIGHCMMDERRLIDSNKLKRSSQISREKTFDNLISITSQIQSLDTDFILLQEVDHDSSRSDETNQIEYIYTELKNHNAHFAYNFNTKYVPFPLNNPVGGTHSGLLTLSKYRKIKSTRYQLDGQEAYPKSMFYLKRCMMVDEYQIKKNKKLYIINIHLSSYDKEQMFRTKQFNDMLEYIKQLYDPTLNYIIVGGDFNFLLDGSITNYPEWLEYFPETLQESDFSPIFEKGTSTLKSSNSETTLIDGYLVSSNINVVKCKTQDFSFKYSNHNPVVMTFKLKK